LNSLLFNLYRERLNLLQYSSSNKESLINIERRILTERKEFRIPPFYQKILQAKKFKEIVELVPDESWENCKNIANSYTSNYFNGRLKTIIKTLFKVKTYSY